MRDMRKIKRQNLPYCFDNKTMGITKCSGRYCDHMNCGFRDREIFVEGAEEVFIEDKNDKTRS